MSTDRHSPSPGHVLVVDDEAAIRQGLKRLLDSDGHEVHLAVSGAEALRILERFPCEAAIIDIGLPDMTGIDLLQIVRGRWPHVAVLILTGQATLNTAIAAVRERAYDYLLKPAAPEAVRSALARALTDARVQRQRAHFLANLRSNLDQIETAHAEPRETGTGLAATALQAGKLCIDPHALEVDTGEEIIALTPSECRVLVLLARAANDVVDYTTLVRDALEYESEPWEAKELVKRHIFTLRQKLEPTPGDPRYILNVRGVGYRLRVDPA